jgi:F420-dependent oxidoreductase-like protein
MKIGVVVPQGWTGEYAGWEATRAWHRMLAVAGQAEALGFESLWVFDHFHTDPVVTDELTFESFTVLTALAVATYRVRLGHLVLCAGYRNPALTAKMIGTLDVVSGGRVELGIGAGWKEDEWRGFGYGFPPLRERLAALRDDLEVLARMLAPGRATYAGSYAKVDGAVNLPRGLQEPRIPLMVGGNGPEVTWRLAAAYAEELNLDWLGPDEVAAALPVIQARCDEIGRDPATLRVSLHLNWDRAEASGQRRIDDLARLAALGVSRVQIFDRATAVDDGALVRLAEDVRAAGLALEMDGKTSR